MNRWKLTVEYDGSDFVGWQRQDNGPSVQQSLEEAVERLAGETVRVHGAGRTDAGVHALGQVAHFDMEKDLSERAVRDGLNHHMRPARITVLKAEAVSQDFHARVSAASAATSTASSTAARRWRWTGAGHGRPAACWMRK